MRRLALFARAPDAGRVKTRLVPALPERSAAALYAGLLADSFAAVNECVAHERCVYWADTHAPAPASITSRAQTGMDLGERLAAAFDELLADGARALIVGSDAPSLAASHLAEALAALDRNDAVLGPTLDGGYWCVGLGQPAPELFRDIPWSTSRVLEVTLARAKVANLRVATVSTLDDIDTPADLARLVGRLAAGEPACGRHTRAALHALGLVPAGREAPRVTA